MTENIYRNRIREAIKARKITQSELASKTGFTQSKVSRILEGRSKLSMDDAVVLASALGLSISALVGDDESFYREIGIGQDSSGILQRSKELLAVIKQEQEFIESSLVKSRELLSSLSRGPVAWQKSENHKHPLVISNFVIDQLDISWDQKTAPDHVEWSHVGLIQELADRCSSVMTSYRELKNLADSEMGKKLEQVQQAEAEAAQLEYKYSSSMNTARSLVGQALLRSGLINKKTYDSQWKGSPISGAENQDFQSALDTLSNHLLELGYDCTNGENGLVVLQSGSYGTPKEMIISLHGIEHESAYDSEARSFNSELAKTNKQLVKNKLSELGYKSMSSYKKSEHWLLVIAMYADLSSSTECIACGYGTSDLNHWSHQYLGKEQDNMECIVRVHNHCYKSMEKALTDGQDIRLTYLGREMLRKTMAGEVSPEIMFQYFNGDNNIADKTTKKGN